MTIELVESGDAASLAESINHLRDVAHEASVSGGWWTDRANGLDLAAMARMAKWPSSSGVSALLGRLVVSNKLALIHSEVSEALEGDRKGLKDDKLPHRSMLEVELADAVIRIMDLAGALRLDIGGALVEKMAFNAVRPDHKPEARAAEGGKAY